MYCTEHLKVILILIEMILPIDTLMYHQYTRCQLIATSAS